MAFTADRLASALDGCLATLERPATGLCVALSGGLDSTVLLAGLARARAASTWPPLRAAHVDHGLHADSGAWAERCAVQALKLGVPLVQVRVDARPEAGESPEAVARKARYAALAGCLAPGEVLLTAHHADDQLETVLLQWLRGGGLRSVAGMPAVAAFARGWHARPLLGFSRVELHSLGLRGGTCVARGPVEPRSALRSQFPAARGPAGAAAALACGGAHRRAGCVAGRGSARSRGRDCRVRPGRASRKAAAFRWQRLLGLPEPRQRWVLRAWLRRAGLPVPSARTLAALLQDVTRSADDRVPCVNWPGARVYRYRGRLYGTAGNHDVTDAPPGGSWDTGKVFDLGPFGSLELKAGTGIGLSRARLPGELQVAWRAAGELFRPAGTGHRRPLRKWLQERGVLPWLRQRVPLVFAQGEIVAIGDLAYCDGFRAQPGEPSWAVAWQGRPVLTEQEALETRADSPRSSCARRFAVAGGRAFR